MTEVDDAHAGEAGHRLLLHAGVEGRDEGIPEPGARRFASSMMSYTRLNGTAPLMA